MTAIDDKKRFLLYELGLLSIKASLSTRDKAFPIYSSTSKLHQRTEPKSLIRGLLGKVESIYIGDEVAESAHIRFIKQAADELSESLNDDLFNCRFRIGVTQKLVNLHLKYLWTAGLCSEPPHCPIDGIIRDKAGIDYNWTRSDDIGEYVRAIENLKLVAGKRNLSLSQWELESFRRRDDI